MSWAGSFLPLKLPLHVRGSGPPSNYMIHTLVHVPNDILIGSSVLHSHHRQTDQQTDLAGLSVTIGRI